MAERSPGRHNTAMLEQMLRDSVSAVPAGRWAIGVSGGADSVALLLLLNELPARSVHVVHLDHQTRDGASGEDAVFVQQLSLRLNLPCTIRQRSDIEAEVNALPNNIPTRYRQARFALFAQIVREHELSGIALGHHADDQAETVLMRLLRGGAAENLAGIREDSTVGGGGGVGRLRIVRPLLRVRSSQLRDFLLQRGQAWREDQSNQSDIYTRNRVRKWLAGRPQMTGQLLQLDDASRDMRDWIEKATPDLKESFPTQELNRLPAPIARHAAASWLVARGAPAAEVSAVTCQRLIEMCADAASSARQHFPGGILVSRKAGQISHLPSRSGPSM